MVLSHCSSLEQPCRLGCTHKISVLLGSSGSLSFVCLTHLAAPLGLKAPNPRFYDVGGRINVIVPIVIGVASALIAAIIWAMLVRSATYWRRRRGYLTGWWWQVTYPPWRDTIFGDAQMTEISDDRPSDSGETLSVPVGADRSATGAIEVSAWTLPDRDTLPWSIELIRVRHQGNEVLADNWRVYNSTDHDPHYDRKWSSRGRCANDSVIDSYYWSEHGEGGHGTFQLWMITSGRFCGQFSQSITMAKNNESSNEFISSYLEWIRLGSDAEHKVLEWFESPSYSINNKARSWPMKVRNKMRRVLIKTYHINWLANFAYCSVLYDNLPVLTIEQLRRELANEQERRREQDRRGQITDED